MEFGEIIFRIGALPQPSQQALQAIAKQVSYPKGHLLLRATHVERKIYFVKTGIVRAFKDHDHKQTTFWFGTAGAPVLSMKSYVSGEKSYENIDLLEDCDFYEFDIKQLKSLFNQDIHLANWGRKLAEQELIKTEERLIAMQFKTAIERYKDLMSSNPALLLSVQLGHIASYLGMSQVSLSRIRAELR